MSNSQPVGQFGRLYRPGKEVCFFVVLNCSVLLRAGCQVLAGEPGGSWWTESGVGLSPKSILGLFFQVKFGNPGFWGSVLPKSLVHSG